MLNKVMLIGNLGKDPDFRRLENNNAVARFPLATHENHRDKSGEWQKVTDWHNIVMWGNQAERAEKVLHKGSTIYLEGKLKTRKWNDKTGLERFTTEVIVISYKLLDKRDVDSFSTIHDEDHKTISSEKHDDALDMSSDSIDIEDQLDDLPF